MYIDKYKFGSIYIDGNNYRKDVILYPDELNTDWYHGKGHLFQLQDLEEITTKFQPQTLIIGTGASGVMKIAEDVATACETRNIELISKTTAKATEHYNKLEDKSQTICALHLTC